MAAESEVLFPEALRSIDSATFTGSYQAVGAVTANTGRIVKFTNNSTSLVTVSSDGSTDHEILPAGSFVLLDCSTNAESNYLLIVAQKVQFYVKGSPGTGLVYISYYFAK